MAGTGPAMTEMRAQQNFFMRINVIWAVQSHLQKYIRSRMTQIKSTTRAVPSQ